MEPFYGTVSNLENSSINVLYLWNGFRNSSINLWNCFEQFHKLCNYVKPFHVIMDLFNTINNQNEKQLKRSFQSFLAASQVAPRPCIRAVAKPWVGKADDCLSRAIYLRKFRGTFGVPLTEAQFP